MDNQTLLRPATDTARLLRNKELSSRELTAALLARIEEVNPALTAVVALRPEQALAEAAAADQAAARGGDLGPLHGVPITIKDAFDVAGLPTTWGNPAFAGHVAGSDAAVVRRLRRAGAVVAGKTNAAFMLGDFGQTANELHGVTANPWDTARTPGGSSGGSAAAVAAGLSFLDYGSDLVGSIRLPASYCGVYGLKPSVATVPPTGFQPPGPPAAPSDMTYLSALGPLARSAGDLRTALADVREARACVELLAEMSQQLDRRPTLNLLVAPEWLAMRSTLLDALRPYPEARSAVAASLMRLEASA
jgi:amidase